MTSVEELPAWSEPFANDRRERLTRLPALDSIDRTWAWGGSTGRGVTIAIIDSGIEANHPDVQGRVVETLAVRLGGEHATVETDDSGDLFGHGTALASIIVGMAPEVDLVSIRVLGSDLKGKGQAFAEAMEYAIHRPVQVANLSLSSNSEALFPLFHQLADEAYFSDVVLVSAANNVAGPSYPSLFSSVISVAAHADADPWRFYYNPSPPVEFGAWGVDVPVAWRDGGRTVVTGNSFAAPHITALVALILAKHPGLTPFEVKSVLAAVANNPREAVLAG